MIKRLLFLALVPLALQGAAVAPKNDYAMQLRKEAEDALRKYSKYNHEQLQERKEEINDLIKQLEQKVATGIKDKTVKPVDTRSVLNNIAKIRGHELKEAQKAKVAKSEMDALRKARGQEVARVGKSLRDAYRNVADKGSQYTPVEIQKDLEALYD